eukprot:303863-Amphidinium_carterae.1
MRIGLSEDRIYELFQSFDDDGSGTIDHREFLKVTRHVWPGEQQCLLTRLVSYVIIEVPTVKVSPWEHPCPSSSCGTRPLVPFVSTQEKPAWQLVVGRKARKPYWRKQVGTCSLDGVFCVPKQLPVGPTDMA